MNKGDIYYYPRSKRVGTLPPDYIILEMRVLAVAEPSNATDMCHVVLERISDDAFDEYYVEKISMWQEWEVLADMFKDKEIAERVACDLLEKDLKRLAEFECPISGKRRRDK